MEVPGAPGNYLAPDVSEMRGYFITIIIGLVAFFAKEVYVWFRNRNDTTHADLIELKKNDMIIMNKMDLILEKLQHKPDRIEVYKEIHDQIEKATGNGAKVR